MKLLNNNKPVTIIITLLLIVIFLLWSTESESHEAPESEIRVTAGSAVIRGEAPTLGIALKWPDAGPKKIDYELGMNLVGESTYNRKNSNVIIVHGMLVDRWKRIELGLGLYWQNVEQEYNCRQGFSLMARYNFTERFAVQLNHFSTAGSCLPNPGRDLLSLSWRF